MQMIALPVATTDLQGICLQTTAQKAQCSAGFAASLEELIGQSIDETNTDEKGLAVLSGLLSLLTVFSTIPKLTDAIHDHDAGVLHGKEAINVLSVPALISGQEVFIPSGTAVVQEPVSAALQTSMQITPSKDDALPSDGKIQVIHQRDITPGETGKSSLPLSGTENVMHAMLKKRTDATANHLADTGASQHALRVVPDKQDGLPVNGIHTGFSVTQEGSDLPDGFGNDELPSKNQESVKLSLERTASSQNSFNETLVQEDVAITGGQVNRGLKNNLQQFEVRDVRLEQKVPEVLHVSKAELLRGDVTSLKVSLAPEGIGELDIELVLNKGMVNGHIHAAEGTGKAAIERNLQHMVDALIKDGINLGGVSVSLRERREETITLSDGECAGHAPALKQTNNVISSSGNGLINIYV